jgi:hypothetical protein
MTFIVILIMSGITIAISVVTIAIGVAIGDGCVVVVSIGGEVVVVVSIGYFSIAINVARLWLDLYVGFIKKVEKQDEITKIH